MISTEEFEMTSEILELASLAYQKNEINKRRRRCWRLMADPSPHWQKIGEEGYEQRKKEMKALTPKMRELRKEVGVSLTWDDSGNIKAISVALPGKYYNIALGREVETTVYKAVIPKRHFKRLHEQYIAEKILLED